MIIKSKQHYISSAILFIVINTVDLVRYLKDPRTFVLSTFIFNEVLLLVIIVVLFFWWKRREILFESTDEGIRIKGSKHGFYAPDFIQYKDISRCEFDRIVIHLHLYNGEIVSLFRLGKNAEKCYHEILQRMGKESVTEMDDARENEQDTSQ